MKLPLTGALVALLALQTGVIVYEHAQTKDEIRALRAEVAWLQGEPKCGEQTRPTPAAELGAAVGDADLDLVVDAELDEDPVSSRDLDGEVEFERGATELAPGDSITVDRIVGDHSALKVGGHYVVHGRYRLTSRARAKLLLSVTTTEPDAAANPASVDVETDEGTFALPLTLTAAGYPHVTFYERDTGRPFSGVYFGHDAWLLRTKSWRYADD